MNLFGNQAHVPAPERDLETRRWSCVSQKLQKFCSKNKISYFHRNCVNAAGFNFDKVLTTWLFDPIDYNYFANTADKFARLGKKLYVVTDSWLDDKFQHPCAKFFSIPKLFGLTALPGPAPEPRSQAKLYNAFYHRADATRQSWFYFLYLRNLLDKGFVSYRLYQINTCLTGQQLFEKIHFDYLSAVDHFSHAYEILKLRIPYANFDDVDDLGDLIVQTKYSVVCDTAAVLDDLGSYYISEKVTRALQYPTTNLFFLQRNTMQKMSESGLYIHPQMLIIDKFGWIERQQKILEILEQDSLNDAPQTVIDQARHNRTLLNSWLQQSLDLSVFQEMFETVIRD